MSRIRDRDTRPELALRKALWAAGSRYRLHYKVTGKPDIVFVRKRLAVFVDGCFWHGCPDHAVKPKTNSSFWAEKLGKNKLRDHAVDKALKREGWRVMRFWEHQVKADAPGIAKLIVATLKATNP